MLGKKWRMLQSPPRRKWYIFYVVKYVRYSQPSEPKKCVSTHRSHTPNLPWSSTVVTLTIFSIKLQSSGPSRGPWYLSSHTEFCPATTVARSSLLKRSSAAKRTVRNHCVLMIFQFFYSPFFQLNCNLWGQPAIRDISAHRPNFAPPPLSHARDY